MVPGQLSLSEREQNQRADRGLQEETAAALHSSYDQWDPCGEGEQLHTRHFATHTATANTLIYFRFVVDACSELNLRQANCLSSIFYLKFRFDTQ